MTRLDSHILFSLLLCLSIYGSSFSLRAEDDLPSIEQLVEKMKPSMVTVLQVGRDGEEKRIGSGFILTENGLIVTNLHVTGEGRRIRVQLANGDEPEVIAIHAWDRKLDLVILKVRADGLKPMALYRGEEVKQGVETIALGNPEGLEFSVTRGVVSGVREVNGIEMLQAAVPIERGNSGGPLINRAGEVIGIVTLKSALTENLGFALPVSSISSLLENPNTIPMQYWQRIGRLNPRLWQVPKADDLVTWRQQAGVISVNGTGAGFGGRALCLSKLPIPEVPYEVAVEVKLDNESGAGGLVFGSDGGERHYGFYPSAGQLRLTRFDGATVYSWNILQQAPSDFYVAEDWNRLRVRVGKERLQCYVNEKLVFESADQGWRNGEVGLCTFRGTETLYRRFEIGKSLEIKEDIPLELSGLIQKLNPESEGALLSRFKELEGGDRELRKYAEKLRQHAKYLDELALKLHHRTVTERVLSVLNDSEVGASALLEASLLIAFLDDPELRIGDYLEEVDRMAVELEENLAVAEAEGALSERQKLELLGLYLFQQNGFHGCRSDWNDKSNSLLSAVLDDREGLPVTLSILYIELGRRMGLNIEGVPMPGRFLVRHQPSRAGASPQLVDVFDGGVFLTEQQAAEMAADSAGVELIPDHLVAATPPQMLVEVIRGIVGGAIEDESAESALPFLDVLVAIAPDEANERLSRAIIRFQSGDEEGASDDVDWLIMNTPPGMDIGRLQEWRDSMSRR